MTIPSAVLRWKKMQVSVGAMRALVLSLMPHAPLPDFRRASGLVECKTCGLEYSDHPRHPALEWLTVLCDGDVVKL